jgi:hypothetical protein
LFVIVALTLFSACATGNRVQVVPTTTFDRAWNAAIDAARFEGVRVASAVQESGLIIGTKGQQDVTIHVRQEADGSARLEIDVRAPEGADSEPGLAGRISRAYDRRMQR